MTRTSLARIGVWLGSLGATLGVAWGQVLEQHVADLKEAMKGPVQKLDESQEWAKIDRAARTPVDKSKFSCKPDSASPFPELEKSKAALKAVYPDLQWRAIDAIAEEVARHDLAIILGTDCQDYVFETHLKALEGATFAGIRCSPKTGIDLSQCVWDTTCAKAGRYSKACGAKFSWER